MLIEMRNWFVTRFWQEMARPDLPVAEIHLSAESFFANFSADIPVIFEALLSAGARTHRGIDYFSIYRAIVKWPLMGRICGLSTIEQQLARIIFPRRGNRLVCKVRELAHSREMVKVFAKESIWPAISNAFTMGPVL